MITTYLSKYSYLDQQVYAQASSDLAVIIVIPARNEPDLIQTLESLLEADQENIPYEVLLVFNHSEDDDPSIKEENIQLYIQCERWLKDQSIHHIHLIKAFDLPKKHAGVGLARKIGMDEALRRFNGNINGIIVALDADCTVKSNYLTTINSFFNENPSVDGASIHFEHPLENLDPIEQKGIIQYELHLRYYNQLLRYAGHPFAYHTVGSSMAVRASAYIKQGGMNKRKAGEDFYFLQKIIQLGKFGEIKDTCVYPSARISSRVPFGTGRAMGDWLNNDRKELYSYHPSVAKELKVLIETLHRKGRTLNVRDIPLSLLAFLSENSWTVKLDELLANTGSNEAFIQRFFAWFNLFMCFKYVHFYRDNYEGNIAISIAARELATMINLQIGPDINDFELLKEFRKRES